jgi:hypothetical protein
MANPVRIVLETSFKIAMLPSVAANLPTIRYADNGFDTYGLPAGYSLYDLRLGDVITDPTCIATILGITSGESGVFPSGLLPKWSAF